ncbi:putative virion core cysteine protease [Yalta virus]|nr:putative virion core cysteine protease [Yalta virus]
MYQNTYLKNLLIPETTLGFSLNMFYKYSNLMFVPSPEDYNTSGNIRLLRIYDNCDETRNKISFIPLEFLISYVGKDDMVFDNLIDKKKHYYKRLIEEHNIKQDFFIKNKFKGIPLQYFRKPFLNSDLSKTIDQCRITFHTEEENIANNKIDIGLLNPTTDIIRNKNEWLSKNDIISVIISSMYELPECKRKNINFKGMLFIDHRKYLTRQFFFSQIKESFNWSNINSSRFILFFILYRSHFTAVVIDLDVTTKNQHKTKFAYFFNSCGYNPNNFTLDKNYWFIDGNMSFLKHKDCYKEYNNNNYINTPIEALTDILKKEYGVTNFVFNTFSIQNLDSECGMFSTMFLLSTINIINVKKEDITANIMRYVYFNMLNLGCDHIYSCFRGLHFFTFEDLEPYQMTKSNFLNSGLVYRTSNTKFKIYKKIYIHALKDIVRIGNSAMSEINNIEEI